MPRLEPTAMAHHDYVWARLPFLLPMAVRVARRHGSGAAYELAHLIRVLHPLLLDHLDREESLVGAPPALDPARLHAAIRADHLAVTTLIDEIRGTSHNFRVRDDAELVERALYYELAQLDDHVRSQITIEDQAWTVGGW